MTAVEKLEKLVDFFDNLTDDEAKEIDKSFAEYLKQHNPEKYKRIKYNLSNKEH